MQKALDEAEPDPEGVDGTRIRLDAPDMPTMALDVHRFESGEETRPARSTTNAIYCVMQGRGTTTIDGEPVSWERGDTFAGADVAERRPQYRREDAVVFRMSDEPLMKFAKYYRRELD